MKMIKVGTEPTEVISYDECRPRPRLFASVAGVVARIGCQPRSVIVALQSGQSDLAFWKVWQDGEESPTRDFDPNAALQFGALVYVKLQAGEKVFAWSAIENARITCWEAGRKPAFEQLSQLVSFKSRRIPANSDIRKEMWSRQGCACALCGRLWPEELISEMSEDHIIPRSKGGNNSEGNLQLTCPTCNSSKGDMDNRDAITYLRSAVNMSVSKRRQWRKTFNESIRSDRSAMEE